MWRARLEMPCRWRGQGWRQVSGEPGAILRNDLTIDERSVVLERVLVIDDWCLPCDRSEGYARLVTDLAHNVSKLWARVNFGRISPAAGRTLDWRLVAVGIWLLFVFVIPTCNSH